MHRPKTEVRLLHDDTAVYVMFRVEDRFVRAAYDAYQDPVHKDSCVEFFAMPVSGKGYFNFEMNAIGTLHLSYIEDPDRSSGAFAKSTPVPITLANQIRVHTSLSRRIRVEDDAALTWTVSYRIPLEVLEEFVGELGALSGQVWRANFYKCADDSSKPHWGYWADIGETLDFHQPKHFAPISFGENRF